MIHVILLVLSMGLFVFKYSSSNAHTLVHEKDVKAFMEKHGYH